MCSHNATLTNYWVNDEHCLIGTHSRVKYSFGLVVCCIKSYHNPVLSPGNHGSRSTSGGAGESGRLAVKYQASYIW